MGKVATGSGVGAIEGMPGKVIPSFAGIKNLYGRRNILRLFGDVKLSASGGRTVVTRPLSSHRASNTTDSRVKIDKTYSLDLFSGASGVSLRFSDVHSIHSVKAVEEFRKFS